MVVTTDLGTLHVTYKRSLASETFLSTLIGTVVVTSTPIQSDISSEGERRRKRSRQWRLRDRAQSAKSVAS
ncbi:hypothetical protein Sjap_011173 [Stephania japonica]|uniref:Uncharacterized protein n=1 Tax=Stephania japonica TaxID=461633 RepID=A0AAP0JAT5_9MAGN